MFRRFSFSDVSTSLQTTVFCSRTQPPTECGGTPRSAPACISSALVSFPPQTIVLFLLVFSSSTSIEAMALKQVAVANALPALVTLFILYRLVATVRQYLRLQAFKGPWVASISSIWLVRAVNKGHLHLKTHEVLRKYGQFQALKPRFPVEYMDDLHGCNGCRFYRSHRTQHADNQ